MAKTIKTKKDKDLKISDVKTRSKDNDKCSRSKITKHEGTSLQQDIDQDSRAQRQHNLNDLTLEEIVSLKILSRTMEALVFI
ncbi:hypothetical protein Tco_0821590 [Tanacetum coccineum]|uniref:Uncharacterized protein n=1 Tax=Tanacetum coccineum TaxID=301880 RepID=A0ABQ5AGX4_9ASTR